MLKKMVDGIEVVCSPEEEAEIRAEWAANDARKQAEAEAAAEKQQTITNLKQSILSNPASSVKNADLAKLLEALGV